MNELRQFVNVGSDSGFRLLVGYMLAMFRPHGPYPILILNGVAGSAKSTMAKVIRRFVDPYMLELQALPWSERDLAIAAHNSWLQGFDNLSGMTQRMSDAICRLATGSGFRTRQLYSDLDETMIDACRPIILNGIEALTTTGGRNTDLFDRAIVLELPEITPADRRSETEFWRSFKEAQPRILGALLDAVSTALREEKNVRLDEMPRMADFVIWVTAAETSLGWPSGTFLRCFQENLRDSEVDALEASPIYAPLVSVLDRYNGHWRGTATELLNELNNPWFGEQHQYGWPRDAARLSGHLNRISKNLKSVGIQISRDRSTDRNRTKYIVFQRVAEADAGGPSPDAEKRADPTSPDASDATDAVLSLDKEKKKKGSKGIDGRTNSDGEKRTGGFSPSAASSVRKSASREACGDG